MCTGSTMEVKMVQYPPALQSASKVLAPCMTAAVAWQQHHGHGTTPVAAGGVSCCTADMFATVQQCQTHTLRCP